MTLEEECKMSYYIPVAAINEDHEVFLVQHTLNNQIFVKKTLHYYNLEMLSELRDHPVADMPRIYELFEDTHVLYVIEEHLSGSTLEDILTEQGPMDESRTIRYIRQLCGIVGELHSRRPPIIHRDIKPSNIIITPDGKLKLLDLSAAKLSTDDKNQDTVLMGTAGYAAPEQYGFTSSSTLTDIYSIGVLMNRMLTGEMLNVKRYIGPLTSVINKCTQLNPSERYQCIKDLLDAISAAERKPADTTSTIMIADNKRTAESGLLKYFPPGLRSGKIIPSLFALLGYVFLFAVTFSINSKKGTVRANIVNRIGATIAFLVVIFFSGNYLGCQRLLPLSRSKNKVVHILGVILWDIVFFVGIVMIITALEG